jgi:hypothetical protein
MSERISPACFFNRLFFGVFLIGCLFSFISVPMQAEPADDVNIAKNLADMLRAARQVISSNQARINDPSLGDKGLTGQVVLQQAVEIFKKTTGTDPASIDPTSRFGRLMHAQMDAIVEATDANQATINAKGVGFKAFIPAVFARLVNESFESHARTEETGSRGPTSGKVKLSAASCFGRIGHAGKPMPLKSKQKGERRIG